MTSEIQKKPDEHLNTRSAEVNKLGKGLRILLAIVIALAFIMLASAGGVYFHYSKDLPKLITISDYHPPVITQIVDRNNKTIAEFYKERRTLIPYEKIGKNVIEAFLAAEDDSFFEHTGFNYQSMLRAFWANLKARHVVQGGSTITQQVTKTLLLTSEKSFTRKIKELILASQLEANLTKEQILFLYLNQIYLGHGAYGVEAAAQTYYRKSCDKLTIAEAALLAGLPQAPSKYSPNISPKKSKERQEYVLKRLFETKKISLKQRDEALVEPIKIYHDEDINQKFAAYAVEHTRKYLLEKYGEKTLYEGGLLIQLPLDANLALVARRALKDGLEAIDRRQGFRGPTQNLKDKSEINEFLDEQRKKLIDKKLGFKLLTPQGELDPWRGLAESGITESQLLEVGETYSALITGRNQKSGIYRTMIGAINAELEVDVKKWGGWNHDLKVGDVVSVRVTQNKETDLKIELTQVPQIQGALLSIEVKSGEVLAMEGGYDFEQSEFNRATQAQRQPGSAYKPIIYAAGLEIGMTPASIILDAPIVYDDGEAGKWKPANYEEKFYGETTFRQALIKSRNVPTIKIVQAVGVNTLIEYSKRIGLNTQFPQDLSISLGSMGLSLLDLTKLYALFPRLGRKQETIWINMIKNRDGLELEKAIQDSAPPGVIIPPLIPVVSEGSPGLDRPEMLEEGQELTEEEEQVQSKAAADRLLGKSPSPSVSANAVSKRRPGPGQKVMIPDYPLEQDPAQVLDPRVAYVMTHLMKEVVNYGTGYEAKQLGRPAAGKTGTTNDSVDAWFMGFTPEIVTGVWIGYDNQKPIGQGETGAKAALPIWLNFMKEAVKKFPESDFEVPPHVVFAKIDPATGKLAPPNASQAIKEAFIEGTEPTEFVGKRSLKPKSQSDFFKEDTE